MRLERPQLPRDLNLSDMTTENEHDSVEAVGSSALLAILGDREAVHSALDQSGFADIDAGGLARIAINYLRKNDHWHELQDITEFSLRCERRSRG